MADNRMQLERCHACHMPHCLVSTLASAAVGTPHQPCFQLAATLPPGAPSPPPPAHVPTCLHLWLVTVERPLSRHSFSSTSLLAFPAASSQPALLMYWSLPLCRSFTWRGGCTSVRSRRSPALCLGCRAGRGWRREQGSCAVRGSCLSAHCS